MSENNYDAMKVLVLDDEKLIRITVCARLRKAGYDTVAVETVDKAIAILRKDHHTFSAVITDIMMGDMDGFDFRNMVRGDIDPNMPFFFMTALDPEEGSGFLKKIINDPMSYYLPKSAGTEVLVKRLQRVIGARRIQRFVENQVIEQRKSLSLAAHVQRSMLPARAMMNDRYFYTTWWCPRESVSGDLYEVMALAAERVLFVLGDIQGHGTNAALVMMAVQAFLRQIAHTHLRDKQLLTPDHVANRLQEFFRENFADVSYMTAQICIYSPPTMRDDGTSENGGTVSCICCGTASLTVIDIDKTKFLNINPDHRGNLPIGLMPDTVYSTDDVITETLPVGAVCVAASDGTVDLSRDEDGADQIPRDLSNRLALELVTDSGRSGSIVIAPDKYMAACIEFGYDRFQDDVSILMFGGRRMLDGIYEATTPLSPSLVDNIAQTTGRWCAKERWPESLIDRVQLVLEEHLMNIYDHGFDDHQRRKEVVSIRLRQKGDHAELTVWDFGNPQPSLKVAAGDTGTAFTIVNNEMSCHGRGRLMVRELSTAIQRQNLGSLNETIFYIPWNPGEGGAE
ncbi:MAG: SpoIIE family protein phosphatase [Kiritimatiellae bacterium]|nr:SpoIIE family protein phosphatase [Kiritimatiellia bacterium]